MSSGGRHSHKSETRISAIADFARERKRKKKRSRYPYADSTCERLDQANHVLLDLIQSRHPEAAERSEALEGRRPVSCLLRPCCVSSADHPPISGLPEIGIFDAQVGQGRLARLARCAHSRLRMTGRKHALSRLRSAPPRPDA